MFSTFLCQTSDKLDQLSSQVAVFAAWLARCFCKTKKEMEKKGGIKGNPGAINYLLIFRQLHTKHMPLKIFQAERLA